MPLESAPATPEPAGRASTSRVEDAEPTAPERATDRPRPRSSIGRTGCVPTRFRRPAGLRETTGRVRPAPPGRTFAASPPGPYGPATLPPQKSPQGKIRAPEQAAARQRSPARTSAPQPARTPRSPDRTTATPDAGPDLSERGRNRATCRRFRRDPTPNRRLAPRSPRDTWDSGSSCPPSSPAPSVSSRTRCTARWSAWRNRSRTECRGKEKPENGRRAA